MINQDQSESSNSENSDSEQDLASSNRNRQSKNTFSNNTSNKNTKNQSPLRSSSNNLPNQQVNVILVFDTVYLMDEASWKLLDLVREYCQKLAIILLIQTDTNNQPKIHPEAKTFFQETFGNNLEQYVEIIDLTPFTIEDLSILLVELSPHYQQSMIEEIQLMTRIEDPAHSIKSPEISKTKEMELYLKYQTEKTFTMVSEDVLQVTIERCEGNPLVSLNFVFNLLTVIIILIMLIEWVFVHQRQHFARRSHLQKVLPKKRLESSACAFPHLKDQQHSAGPVHPQVQSQQGRH